MKRIIYGILLFVLIFTITACASAPGEILPQEPETEVNMQVQNTSGKMQRLLSDQKVPQVSQELISAFFDYYGNSYELLLLPIFERGSLPDWDALTMFVYTMADESQRGMTQTSESFISTNVFDEIVKQFFEPYSYNHKSSVMLKLIDEGYVPMGWDITGVSFYRLIDIKKSADNVYTVSFDEMYIYGDDFTAFEGADEYLSQNMKTIIATAGNTTTMKPSDMIRCILEIFKKDNYRDLLQMHQQVKVEFKLSDDPKHAFIYLSCEKTPYQEAQE